MDILVEISENLQKGKAKVVKELVSQAIDAGIPAREVLEKGLLSGLWEFPNIDGILPVEDAIVYMEKLNVSPKEILRSANRTHVFTHVEWRMQGIYLRCAEESEQFVWATPDALAEVYALPTAFRLFLEQ